MKIVTLYIIRGGSKIDIGGIDFFFQTDIVKKKPNKIIVISQNV